MSEKAKAIIRLLVVIVLFINGFLSAIGKSPISNDEVYAYVSEFVTLLGTGWTWWKNNNVTEAAAEAQGLLNALKDEDTMDELSNGKSDNLEWYEDGDLND